MSDYNDIVKSAMDKGILLDSCGSDERQYWWGLYNDLCGMSVEDALRVQYYHQEGDIDPVKKTNIVNFVMQKGGSGNYTLFLVPTYAPTSPVTVTFLMDGASQSVTIPAGVTSFNTELSGSEPTKPYAEISNVSLDSDDEQYNYAGKNSVLTGIFTITINNGGDVTVENVKYGTVVTLPSVPEKEGYTFTWKDSDGNVITGSTIEMPEKDITITGEYTIKQYVLSYSVYEQYLDENEDVHTRVFKESSVTVDFGVKVLDYLTSSSTEREGYSVSKWQTSDGVEITGAFTIPANNLSASCEYELNKYTVKYYSEGELYSEAEYYFGASTIAPANPTKTGYDFDGWTNEVPEKMPARNIETVAKFAAIDYHIYYIIDGETAYTETHHYGDVISIRGKEEREGYSFEWTPSSLPATMPDEDKYVYGEFTPIDYVFKCVVDGIEVVNRTYHFEDAIEEVTDPSKVGYRFTGWNPSIPATMPSADLTCVAEFEINSHTITYYVDDVIVTDYTETRNYGEAIAIREDEAKEGYTFNGWVPSSLPETMPDEDIVVRGTFSINSYELTYTLDGAPYSSETYEFGAIVVPIDAPEKEGYTFSGWNGIPATMPAHDVEASGEFTIDSYVISYVVDDEPYSSETYEFGAAIVPLDEPEKTGYTFGGWSEIPSTMPAHDVEVSGKFTINTHTITYIVDDEAYSSETYDYGQVIVPIAAPAKIGYTFTEWSGITETMPDNNLIVTAVYNINRWIASFSISGDTEQLVHPEQSAFTQEFDYGETIVYPSIEVNSGYTFRWIEEYETMPDSNISITGIIEKVVAVTQTFYGTLPFNWGTKALSYDVASVSALDSIDGTSAVNGAVFTVPSNAEYAAVDEQFNEGEISEKEYDDWLKAHNSALVICAPSYMKSNILLTDAYDASYPLVETGTLIINGTEYTVQYHTDEDFATYAQISTEQSFERIIKINS